MLLFGVALGACGGNSPVARGFDAREVLPLRDATAEFMLLSDSGGDLSLIYTTEEPNMQTATYWSLDLGTGSVQNLGSLEPAAVTAITGDYACFLDPTAAPGTGTLEIFDRTMGVEVDVDDVISYAACPTSDGNLFAFLADPVTGSPVLWSGRYDQLQSVPLAMNVQSVGDWLFDSSGAPSGVLVAAAPAGQLLGYGLYTLDLGSHAFSEDVPPTTVSTAWATGGTPTGSLQSASLAIGSAQAIRAMGDHYLYARTMSDGGTTMFVGPFSSGPASELALFQANPTAVSTANVRVYTSDDDGAPKALAPLAGWSPGSAAGSDTSLMVWHDSARQLVACPSSPGAAPTGGLSSDGTRALFADVPSTGASPGAVTLLSLNDALGGVDSCVNLVDAGGDGADFSPDGEALVWTVSLGGLPQQLWAAAADGSNARMIGSGAIFGVHFLVDAGSEKLEMDLDGAEVGLDLRDDPIVTHDFAPQAFVGGYDLRGSWLLIGYDFNSQDGTGSLGLINRDTGATRLISPDVVTFRLVPEVAASAGGSPDASGATDGGQVPVYDVAYLVRGRNPSPQDGIWVARVSATDLQ